MYHMDRSILNLSSIKEWLKFDVVSSFILLTGSMLRRNVLLKRPEQPGHCTEVHC
jgi:hypothetical protein